MVTLDLRLISVLIFHVIQFNEKNVRGESNDTRKRPFDFREVVAENSGYSPFTDQCALRIYGGRPAKISDIPYQVAIRRGTNRGDNWTQTCGGSIITRQYVVTAAHCFDSWILKNLHLFRVVAGSEKSDLNIYSQETKFELQAYIESTELWRNIAYCYKHAWYDPRFSFHDFAVLQMDVPVYFTQNIQPIPMLRDSLGIKPEENDLCLVSGYGDMEFHERSATLRMVCVPIVSSKRCNWIYGRGTVKSFQLCAGDKGKDSCQGDSGGPITYHGYLIGIVSYGGRCGVSPGVYSLVSSYTTGDEFTEKNVRCESNDTTKKSFDFREVVEENSGYSPFTDQCALRIYGGRPAKISDIPYQVVIRRGTKRGDRWTLLCGGSIITRQYVLTAAHCFERPALKILRFFRVVAGSEKSELYIYSKQQKVDLQRYIASNELWRKIAYCYIHAWYNSKYILHDFAVLQMDRPVYYTKNIQPIPMLRDSLGIKLEENGLCLVSGYGYMEYHKRSATLRMVCVPVVSRERCNRIYGRGTVRSIQFCAGDKGKDSCQGDSGGPITYHGYLIGIVSYGGRCGEAPGVYSLVSSYTTGAEVPFIRNHCVPICFNFFGIVLVLGLSLIY